MLDFSNVKLLTVERLERADLRRHAKFGRNRLNAAEIWRFFDFSRWRPPPSWILKILAFNGRTAQEVEICRHANFGRNRSNRGRDMAIFGFFQDGGRPPSWICDACVRTTHEGHLVVFITVQNLVGIDTVVSIICKFYYFAT